MKLPYLSQNGEICNSYRLPTGGAIKYVPKTFSMWGRCDNRNTMNPVKGKFEGRQQPQCRPWVDSNQQPLGLQTERTYIQTGFIKTLTKHTRFFPKEACVWVSKCISVCLLRQEAHLFHAPSPSPTFTHINPMIVSSSHFLPRYAFSDSNSPSPPKKKQKKKQHKTL